MGKRITIAIVTNRVTNFESCIKRVMSLPGIDKAVVSVYDNCTEDVDRVKVQVSCEVYGCNYKYYPEFITCRNQAIRECTTDYFTILDDDDYLASTALIRIFQDIDKYPNADIFSYNWVKEGRFEVHNLKETVITSNYAKLLYLNTFQNYESDRLSKIYLSNCGMVLRSSLLKDKEWKYIGCDDILPITAAYIEANQIVKINFPLYYYTVQSTVTSKKQFSDILRLEDGMRKSYEELMDKYKDLSEVAILKKSIENSMNQLNAIDNHYSERLETLIHLCKFTLRNRTSSVEL